LVRGRSQAGADDIAAILHARVDGWIQASGTSRKSSPNRIVGLFPAAERVTDRDLKRALDDRRRLLEQRARTLALTAIPNGEPWAMKLRPRRTSETRVTDASTRHRSRHSRRRGADPPLGEGVRTWGLRSAAQHLDSGVIEDRAESSRELGIPIPDQKPESLRPLPQGHQQAPRWLSAHGPVGLPVTPRMGIRRVLTSSTKNT
jgi:hypothetical protein